ncbi:MAG: RHS repeat-associated core domain-containing protein, partial [Oscillospiraceae bacterium]|nr:RHS repeat-associated core domain-containing protein [Oscillospiraceae bacterium]
MVSCYNLYRIWLKFSNLSYFYDEETNLYYLNSRYYNPQWGRFISADSVLLPEDLFGHNQFAYCGNNPVVYDDPTGHALDVVFDIISFGLSLKGVLDDPTDPYAWLALGVDALCLALPFMTGGGTAVRALNAMDNALDYARAADRATDAARVANVAAD